MELALGFVGSTAATPRHLRSPDRPATSAARTNRGPIKHVGRRTAAPATSQTPSCPRNNDNSLSRLDARQCRRCAIAVLRTRTWDMGRSPSPKQLGAGCSESLLAHSR